MTRSREYVPKVTAVSIRRKQAAEAQAKAEAEAKAKKDADFETAWDEIDRLMRIGAKPKARKAREAKQKAEELKKEIEQKVKEIVETPEAQYVQPIEKGTKEAKGS